MKKLSNTEADLKKALFLKKMRVFMQHFVTFLKGQN